MAIHILRSSSMCRRRCCQFSVNFINSRNESECSFLNGSSSQYIENMYNVWLSDPSKVHASWDSYFRSAIYQSPYNSTMLSKISASKIMTEQIHSSAVSTDQTAASARSTYQSSPNVYASQTDLSCVEMVREYQELKKIIRTYQYFGHLIAKLDPLDLNNASHDLLLDFIQLEGKDMDKIYNLQSQGTYVGGQDQELSLGEIIQRLESVYCGTMGIEYMHISDFKHFDWIRKRIEPPYITDLTTNEKLLLLERLILSCDFEAFLEKKWPTVNRFGLEGCDVTIPALQTIIDRSTEIGVENFVIGMAHRGRLNVLANICRNPLHKVLTLFQALQIDDEGTGDVIYHLGSYAEGINETTSKNVRIILVANPSHLEIVAPVVVGRTKAEQFFRGDCEGRKTVSILLHGDAAFSAQGIVYETINLANLPVHKTHGTIHVVINNQVGFTTDPDSGRSSHYCTDVGKISNAPIFHVNADDPEKVVHLSKLAADYRGRFRKDVVLDIVGYRRHGHNETDQPNFTQPIMYQKVKSTPSILNKYSQKLIAEGLITEQKFKDSKRKFDKFCEAEWELSKKEEHIISREWIDSPWSSFFSNLKSQKIAPTGIQEKVISHIGKTFSSPPRNGKNFTIHEGIKRVLKSRMELVDERRLDWSLGEAVAIGSLLKEGIHVRLTGQDVERGSFSNRHHVLHHQTVDKAFHNPLCHLYPDQATYTVGNSALCEYGVLAFELGYSLSHPKALVIWEAQFGDFANNAQPIFDNFISSGEAKWIRQSGLVVLLPHGLEGQGPEHSSARVERFLQLCKEDPDTYPPETEHFVVNQLRNINWIVANCTTPANFVHILRRQLALPFRKPLMLLSPKSLIRLPEARSSFDDILEGTEFKAVLPDEGPASKDPSTVKKLIFCTGKVYYDLIKFFKGKKVESQIAVTRIEQLCPFPFHLVNKEICKYSEAQIVWCQEEHKNQGAWLHVQSRIKASICGSREIQYIGRPISASTATGFKVKFFNELNDFLQKAADIGNQQCDNESKEKNDQTKLKT